MMPHPLAYAEKKISARIKIKGAASTCTQIWVFLFLLHMRFTWITSFSGRAAGVDVVFFWGRATATHKHMEFFLILNVSASPSPSPYIPRRAACTPTSSFLSTLSRDPLPREHRRRWERRHRSSVSRKWRAVAFPGCPPCYVLLPLPGRLLYHPRYNLGNSCMHWLHSITALY